MLIGSIQSTASQPPLHTMFGVMISHYPTAQQIAFVAPQPVLRDDSSDVVFSSESGKWNAVLTEIKRMHNTGRPVLVGTTSVERSEQLAELLQEAEITYQVSDVSACWYVSLPAAWASRRANGTAVLRSHLLHLGRHKLW